MSTGAKARHLLPGINLNVAFLLAARVVSALTTLLVIATVARFRTGEELGLVGVGLALGGVVGTATDAGTSALLVREAARDRSRTAALLGAMLASRLVTVPLAIVLLVVTLPLAYPERPLAVLLPAVGMILVWIAEVTRAVFIAHERMLISSVHTIVENVAWLVVVAGALLAGQTVEVAFALALVVLGGSVLAGLLLDVVVARTVPTLPPRAELAELARDGAPFAAFSVVNSAQTRIDTVFVSALVPGAALVAAGAYFAAARLIAAFEYLPEAVARSLYPALSRTFAARPADVTGLLRPATRTLLFIGVAAPFVMLVADRAVTRLLLGDAYAGYAWVLLGLAATVPFRYLGHLFGITLTGSDAHGRRVVAALLALISNVVLDVLLLPRFGVVGAVVAAVAGAAIVCLIYLREVRLRFGRVEIVRPLAVALVAAGSAAAVALAVRSFAGEIAGVVAFLLAYALALGVARAASLRLRWNNVRVDSGSASSATISKSAVNAARKPSSE